MSVIPVVLASAFARVLPTEQDNAEEDQSKKPTQKKNKGLLYVTNKRIIFVSDKNAFDKKLKSLTAITPYSNAVQLQFSSKTYTVLVPDGGVVSALVSLINNT